jgi:hypothetical protein
MAEPQGAPTGSFHALMHTGLGNQSELIATVAPEKYEGLKYTPPLGIHILSWPARNLTYRCHSHTIGLRNSTQIYHSSFTLAP